MYTLFVSDDCGISYCKEGKAKTIEELEPRMKKLDEDMLRWYIEKDGESYNDVICHIHKSILGVMTQLIKQNSNQ